MTSPTRRDAFKTMLASTLAAPLGSSAAVASSAPAFASGSEGQRRADRGDGTYVNPIVPGDHPDPTVLKDGDDYYMTFSSFFSYPGVVIWHSRDLVNWTPIGPALVKPLGTVWAMDLVKHGGRYFIYIPANPGDRQSIFDTIWSGRQGHMPSWSGRLSPTDIKILALYVGTLGAAK